MLSNLLLVTESLTLMAGKSSVPASIIWYRRWTPVVVSSLTPRIADAMRVQRDLSFAIDVLMQSRMTPHSSGSLSGLNAGTFPAFSNSAPLCTTSVASPPSSTMSVGPLERLARAPPVLLERLAFPREHRRALGIADGAARFRPAHGDRGGRVILRREDVARHPANVGAELGQRLDEHRRLNRHVEGTHDARAGERLLRAMLLPQRHQPRHFLLGQTDF